MILLELVPCILLPLCGIGFVLALIADHFSHEARMKIGILMILFAAFAIMAMK